jgi:hypothetical protein
MEKEASKKFIVVGGIILLVIVLLGVLFLIAPEEVRVGQAVLQVGGVAPEPGPPVACPAQTGTTNNPFRELRTSRLLFQDGTSAGNDIGPFCCRTRNDCVGGVGTNLACFSENSEFTGNARICRSGDWIVCDNDAARQGQILNDFICRNSVWGSLACTDAGLSINNRAFCNPSTNRFVAAGSGCNADTETALVRADGSTTTTTTGPACCPANTCVESVNPNLFCRTAGVTDTNNNLCAGGNWVGCDQTSANERGRFNSNLICRGGTWQQPVCTAAERGQSYGSALCQENAQGSNVFVPCPANVYCPNTADALESTELCNALNLNTIAPRPANADAFGTHYCTQEGGAFTWIECTRERLGQGVVNANPSGPFAENYVCSQIPRSGFNWVPVNCQACAGAAAGRCVGSSILDVTVGRASTDINLYYFAQTGPLIRNQVGCVDDTVPQCTFNNLNYRLDESDTAAPANGPDNRRLCGNNHNWQVCPLNFNGFVVSDGGSFLCATYRGDSGWNICDRNRVGTQLGNYVCTNTDEGYKWFSEFECNPSGNFKRRAGNSAGTRVDNLEMCYSGEYRTCEYFDTNPIQEDGVRLECTAVAPRTIEPREVACTNNIDDDNDGNTDCADTDCFGALGHGEHFSVTIQRYGCRQAGVSARANDGALRNQNMFRNFNLCDTGTDGFINRATICHGNIAAPTLLEIPSVRQLNSQGQRPVTSVVGNISFLYYETPGSFKQVHAVYTEDLTDGREQGFDSTTFFRNMRNGQRLMLRVNRENYLLTLPAGTTGAFSLEQLELRHVPLGRVYPGRLYAGTNRYQFNVEDGRSIFIRVESGRVFISVGEALEVAAAYSVPQNLWEKLQVTFTQATPVEISNEGVGNLTICRSDVTADPVQVLLCRKGPGQNDFVQLASLRRGNLTRVNVGGQNYAFLYTFVNDTKTVSIFNLTRLGNVNLPYGFNNFIDAMINGRRAAFEFENKLYLAVHPEQVIFSLPAVVMRRYVTDTAPVSFPSTGSDDRVEFMVLDGRLTIQRNYATPPPPFDMRAETRQQIADTPLDLNERLFTSMSSQIPVRIDGPTPYGLVNLAADELIAINRTLRLNSATATRLNQGDNPVNAIDLLHSVPQRRRNAANNEYDTLFYYLRSEISGNELIKTAEIFRLYVLDQQRQHALDANFIDVFTKGSEVALQLGGEQTSPYFRLGYQGQTQGVQFFDLGKLRLRTLNGDESFEVDVDRNGTTATFRTLQGDIRVDLAREGGVDLIKFSPTLQEQALTQELDRSYALILAPDTRVVLNPAPGEAANPVRFFMCDVALYSGVQAANLCWEEVNAAGGVVGNRQELLVEGSAGISAGTQGYFVEVNRLTGDRKRVLISKIYDLSEPGQTFSVVGDNNWTWFSNHLISGDIPMFNVSDRLYLPIIQSNSLDENFIFRRYPQGPNFALRAVQRVSPIIANGSFIIDEALILVNQTLGGGVSSRSIFADFVRRPYDILPEDGSVIRMNASAIGGGFTGAVRRFQVALDQGEHRLEISRTAFPRLVRLTLFREGRTIMERYFAEGTARRIFLNDQLVEIRVPRINVGEERVPVYQYADITIRRAQ